MLLSNYVDIITRAESCLEDKEQDFLSALLDRYEQLYQSRRATRSEKAFWNQFWHSWDYPKLRDARKQAFDDMAAQSYHTAAKPPTRKPRHILRKRKLFQCRKES